MSKSIYQRVTDSIIGHLENGVTPWVQPWCCSNDPIPRNALSQRTYKGINTLVLAVQAFSAGYESGQWLTFRQALSLGGAVRKGEKATSVVYFNTLPIEEEGSVSFVSARRAFVKTFSVFNLDQIDGLDELKAPGRSEIIWEPDAKAEQLIEQSGADIRHQGFQAYYTPSKDRIYLPERPSFASAQGYYSTALHELSHWSGHPSRLNRTLSKRFGSDEYAMEELVAELGSAFLCAHCRIDGMLQHSSYIDNWLSVLKRDPRAIFTAAAAAQRAADYLLHRAGLAPESIETKTA